MQKLSSQKLLRSLISTKILSRNVEQEHSKEVLDCFSHENFPMPKRYREHMVDTTFWDEFKAWAQKTGATNLGEEQGWCKGCIYTREFLQELGKTKKPQLQQYTRTMGHPRLVKAVADYYQSYLRELTGKKKCIPKIDPFSEILITNGVQEAIYVAIMSIIQKRDEVVIIEPYKNAYVQVTSEAGGTIRYLPLKPRMNVSDCDDWTFEELRLATICNARTKLVIINNPQFPLGKIWRNCEMKKLLHYLQKWNIMVLSDESQDFLTVEPFKHRHFCTQEGFWDRTLTIWTISDIFGLPGWNVACLYGPKHFIERAALVHKDLICVLPTQIQETLAQGLEREIHKKTYCTTCTFLTSFMRGLEPRREMLFEALNEGKFEAVWPQSGYWMVAKYKPAVSDRADHYRFEDCFEDFKFNKWLSEKLKFQGVPMTPFYSKEHFHIAEEYLAFCYQNDFEKIKSLKKRIKKFMRNKVC